MQTLDATEVSFTSAYAMALAACAGQNHRDNYDWRRFGPEMSLPGSSRKKLADVLVKPLSRTGFVRVGDVQMLLNYGLRFAEPHAAQLQWLYEHLDEEESREVLVSLIAFRALGYRHVKLPFNQPEHWRMVETLEKRAQGCETIDPQFLGWQLSKLDLREIGYPMELFCLPAAAVIQFIHEQYRCVTAEGPIEAEEGDVVVDAGGCWGDTALYFAFKAGSRGKVYSFEFLPGNLKVYDRNLALNPELASRIEVLPHPVWSSRDVELYISANGPGTFVGTTRRTEGDEVVRTMTIDQLLQRPDLDRVDFIKMDIEGAELSALQGAEQVLRKFQPRLAITVYHRLSDFWEIPQYIDGLGLGYRFYLRHFTTHAEETVLFATCEGRRA
jgi:FkbM family methyltransferase